MPEPIRDQATVTTEGTPLASLPHGVSFHPLTTHLDDRGWLCEIYDPRWGWSQDPLVYVYASALRPGVIKGWALHKEHDDRYFILTGELEVVLYDARPDSPTKGLVSKVYLSHYDRRLINIPAGIWHADYNIGQTEAVIINCPTTQFDHNNPDKYRLPLDTDEIPYKFNNPQGW